MTQPPQFNITTTPDTTILSLSGRLDARGIAEIWHQACIAVGRANSAALAINLEGVDYLDMAGAAFISHLKTLAKKPLSATPVKVLGLKPEYAPLLRLAEKTDMNADFKAPSPPLALL